MKTLLLTLSTTALLALPSYSQDRDEKRDKPEQRKEKLESLEKRIKSAVERGDLTHEQARAKFAEAKKQLDKTGPAERNIERPVPPKEFAEKMRRAQMEKQQEMVKRIAKEREQAERGKREQMERREHQEHEHTGRQLDEARERAQHQEERNRHARFEAIERSLHQAVEAGLISGLDAQKTMAKLHLAAIKHQQRKSR
ncbi:hypothetical protein N9230_01920 [Akkermansiaceae bacterium]|nr:hypothetical protein [Akkermansiaceae bacterium]